MDDLRRRLRFAYVAGAEDWSQRERDRGLTGEELATALARYPGD